MKKDSENKHFHKHHGHHGYKHHHDKPHHEYHQEEGELLSVRNLWVEYTAGKRIVHAVNGVSFDIRRGESLGIVGESGCGKSTIAKAILRILPDHGARLAGGEMWYKGKNLAEISEEELGHIRGAEISMIFQDPMTALNPVKRIIDQVSSVILLHNPGMHKKEAEKKAVHMLRTVGISEDRVREYPHQFSGGMQQRVEVAIGLSCKPDLLLADEPTTALDVTIQAQVLDLIRELMEKNGTTLLLITHNLGIVAEMCDFVAVVYGGEIVEYGSKREIFKNPCHPYTIGLFGAVPSMQSDGERLRPVEGVMPDPSDLPDGCKFHTRCPYATDLCRTAGVENSYTGAYGVNNGVISCGPVNEEIRPEDEHFGEGGISVWTLDTNANSCTHVELGSYTSPADAPETSVAGVYTLREVNKEGKGVVWTLELNKDMSYKLVELGVVPVHDLGGTHRCQCYHIDAVKAANEKEAAK